MTTIKICLMKNQIVFRTIAVLACALFHQFSWASSDQLGSLPLASLSDYRSISGKGDRVAAVDAPGSVNSTTHDPPGWVFRHTLSRKRIKFDAGELIEVTHTDWNFKTTTKGRLQDITESHILLRNSEGELIKISKKSIQKLRMDKDKENRRNRMGIFLVAGGALVGLLSLIFVLIASAALLPFALLGADTEDTESEAGAPGRALMIILILAGIVVLAFSKSKTVTKPFSPEWKVEWIGQIPSGEEESPDPYLENRMPADMPRA